MKWYNYGYLEEIVVQREDQQLYKFKEGDFPSLNLQDIEDMLLLLVQKKVSNLERDVIYELRLECGITDVYQTYDGNPVKEILFKLNLPDHKLILTDSKICIKMDIEEGEWVYGSVEVVEGGKRPREGNYKRVDDLNGQGNEQGIGANGGIEGVNENVEGVNNGGVVVLTRWIEMMENVQDMSGCSNYQKVKYSAGSFVGKALTWWNSHIRTLSQEVAVSMSWNDFKYMMIEEFCPSHEMQKLETELWNHVMVEVGHDAYTDRFHKLARLVPHLVNPKSWKIERYVYDLASQICEMVAATEPKTMQKAV
ncbi:reverse transcriptase domain-containing protein, partial [Tanacetum coccineum]